MNYEFDKVIDRKGTNCLKYDFSVERGKPEGILPLWVADMDFQTAPEILNRLRAAVEHGIFGYTEVKDDYFQAVSAWYRKHFGWEAEKEWLVKTPGVVFALAAAVRAYTEERDGVLLQQPVYYPFSEVVKENNRKIVNAPLKLIDGHYEIDFEELEEKIVQEKVKLFLLCSPHNPVGRVWREEELRAIGDICLHRQVIVVSDEIHSDFVYDGYAHHVFPSLKKAYEDIAVVCTAPSKTFNLAGLQVSNVWIPNAKMRRKFQREVYRTGYSQLNSLGLLACQAAYEEGEAWLLELKEYLQGNLSYVREFLKECLPQVHLIEPEGTYLLWLDFRELGLTEEELEKLIVEKANLWLDSGAIFGKGGEGFERINIACPRKTLEKAMLQLKEAIDELK